ncbi:hypothetical protein JMJ78_0000907 [Colletotrichum scovillei]|nr:hypothetical protein JMJ78_0000907 [Colletotrichum scovillei]
MAQRAFSQDPRPTRDDHFRTMGVPDIGKPEQFRQCSPRSMRIAKCRFVADIYSSVSFIRSVRELLDMVQCATVEVATAADILESMNAEYKTAVWYADHLRSETNGVAVALEAMTIEAFATPTMPWDEMAGLP